MVLIMTTQKGICSEGSGGFTIHPGQRVTMVDILEHERKIQIEAEKNGVER